MEGLCKSPEGRDSILLGEVADPLVPSGPEIREYGGGREVARQGQVRKGLAFTRLGRRLWVSSFINQEPTEDFIIYLF